MSVPNNTASKYMQQKWTKLKGQIDKYTIVVGNSSGIERTGSSLHAPRHTQEKQQGYKRVKQHYRSA